MAKTLDHLQTVLSHGSPISIPSKKFTGAAMQTLAEAAAIHRTRLTFVGSNMTQQLRERLAEIGGRYVAFEIRAE